MNFKQWEGFTPGDWTSEINVRDFIQANYTPYTGDDSFLTPATEKTTKLWNKVLELYKKEVVKSFYLYEGMHRFLPTLAKINGFSVIEVPVQHFDRMYGKSKYGVWNRLWKGLKDAFAVRWMSKRKINYVLKESR